jgi:mRNA interferase RelE/StbE
MMAYTVTLKRSAEKELDGLPAGIRTKIVNILLSLKENPFPRNSKKLHGREGFRVRLGEYRILYTIDQNEKKVDVVSVAHRKDVYRY